MALSGGNTSPQDKNAANSKLNEEFYNRVNFPEINVSQHGASPKINARILKEHYKDFNQIPFLNKESQSTENLLHKPYLHNNYLPNQKPGRNNGMPKYGSFQSYGNKAD